MLPIIIIGGIILIFGLILFVLGVVWIFFHPWETVAIVSVFAFLAYLYKSPGARKKVKKALT